MSRTHGTVRWSLALIAAATLSAACSGVRDGGPDGATLSLGDAIDRALRARPGLAVEAEGDAEVAYEVKVVAADEVLEVHVSPITGDVTSVQPDDDADEARALVRSLSAGTRALADLVAEAERHASGHAIEAGFETEDGRTVVEVLVRTASGLVEVELDAATGALLELEAADSDDEDDDETEDDEDARR